MTQETSAYVLTRTVASYSAGTRVILLNFTKAHTAFVSVISSKEVLEISQDDMTRLRTRSQVVPSTNSRQRRRERKAQENAVGES